MPETTRFGRARRKIIDVCHAPEDAKTLRVELLAAIRQAVAFDAHVWVITDPETAVGSAPLADVPCLPDLPRLIRLKYLTPANRWTALVGPVATLAGTTGGDLAQSLLWREILRSYGVVDVASAVQRDRFGCWGFLDLWRTEPATPFTPAEVDLLAGTADEVTTALRATQAAAFSVPAAPATPAPAPPGPVVLLLSPGLEVRAQTPQTQDYLRVLLPPGEPGRGPVPAAAYNVAAQLLANEAGVDPAPPLARVHLQHGLWLALRAARIETDAAVEDRDIAVTIEVASPHDRVAVFARAFGLTPREAELVRHLVAGADTRDVARLMYLSQHTVQDHLKSIFAKTGVRRRPALLSRALGA